MRDVEILKQVLHVGQLVKPLPDGGPVLSVPDHTAEHWIATGAARPIAEVDLKAVAEVTVPKPKKGKGAF